MLIEIPKRSLVILCGPAACGKSTFAQKHFLETQIVSSDRCRAIVGDDEADITVSKQAFEVFHFIIEKRLSLGRLTVADSTALNREARRRIQEIGRKYLFHTAILLFDVDEETCVKNDLSRSRRVGRDVIRYHLEAFRAVLANVHEEAFDSVFVLSHATMNDVSFKFSSNQGCTPGPLYS